MRGKFVPANDSLIFLTGRRRMGTGTRFDAITMNVRSANEPMRPGCDISWVVSTRGMFIIYISFVLCCISIGETFTIISSASYLSRLLPGLQLSWSNYAIF